MGLGLKLGMPWEAGWVVELGDRVRQERARFEGDPARREVVRDDDIAIREEALGVGGDPVPLAEHVIAGGEAKALVRRGDVGLEAQELGDERGAAAPGADAERDVASSRHSSSSSPSPSPSSP